MTRTIAIAFATMLLLASCGESADAPQSADIDGDIASTASSDNVLMAGADGEGVALYQEYCAECHEGGVYKAPHVVNFQMSRPEMILAAMDGVMAQQAEDLSPDQRRVLAEFLTGATLGSASDAAPVLMCTDVQNRFNMDAPPPLNGWGLNLGHTRFVDAESAQLTKEDIPKLGLKWAFAYPNATRARSQPTLAGGSVFMGSQDGTIYALNEELGCARWTFQADAEVRSSLTVTPWEAGDKKASPSVYFGDFEGHVYRLDAKTGELIWKVLADNHKDVTLTGSPTLHGGRLYVPLSSTEWASAADPGYECCTFRGGVVALDAETGEQIWKTRSIPEDPRLTGDTNSDGTPTFHPAGAPVWNSPSIDVKRNRLYVGTGEAYTSPAADTSDAILAMDLTTGELLWHYQGTAGDAWNMACTLTERANCPAEDGPDFDFGASPVLLALDDETDIILAGQKAGFVHALNPDTG
ncbi:MAG: PQQ-binding-like beta-propeller repeat protein [Proteobacteria bacterium]|nr:PQQ-binding-like beta-propeller repeat protein [Pseudomonadota bacterium]